MQPTITEKVFFKMLISSVLGILLCMACLVSTSWAWFTVDISNGENVIQIGSPKVTLQLDNADFVSGMPVAAGSHTLQISHPGDQDDFQQKSTLYVMLTLDGTGTVYTILSAENRYAREITLELDRSCVLTYGVSWFAPANAMLLIGDTLLPPAEQEVQTTPETQTTEIQQTP